MSRDTLTPQSKKYKKQLSIAIAFIVALLISNLWWVYKYNEANSQQEVTSNQLDESTLAQEELNKQYDEAQAELEAMRTDNEELNILIEEKQTELEASKERIAGLIRNGGSLKAARAEMNKLRNQVNAYMEEVNQLREQNAILVDENQQLTQTTAVLASDLKTKNRENDSLQQEKQTLEQQQQQLAKTNSNLSAKVTQAATIKVTNLEAVGQLRRRSGKAVTRRNAESVEQIAITFMATANEIAESGNEIFYVRILNPQGETIAINQLGSGVFTNRAVNGQMRYTLMDAIDYSGQEEYLRMLWSPGQQFSKGSYKVEVYNKGYLAGETSFVLK